jgi:hypothetical protein
MGVIEKERHVQTLRAFKSKFTKLRLLALAEGGSRKENTQKRNGNIRIHPIPFSEANCTTHKRRKGKRKKSTGSR